MTGYESKRAAARDKLAQPAQEPVAWLCKADKHGLFGLPTADKACKDCFPVYTTPPQSAQEPVATLFGTLPVYDTSPPQRPWVGLTDDEVYKIAFDLEGEHWRKIADAIEAKLKEFNHG